MYCSVLGRIVYTFFVYSATQVVIVNVFQIYTSPPLSLVYIIKPPNNIDVLLVSPDKVLFKLQTTMSVLWMLCSVLVFYIHFNTCPQD